MVDGFVGIPNYLLFERMHLPRFGAAIVSLSERLYNSASCTACDNYTQYGGGGRLPHSS